MFLRFYLRVPFRNVLAAAGVFTYALAGINALEVAPVCEINNADMC